ncbi:STAS domain-containing protein [Kitasatospora sp. NPDC004240]
MPPGDHARTTPRDLARTGPREPLDRELWQVSSGNGRLRAELAGSDGGRVTARVSGEIDHESAPEFERALIAALRAGPAGLDLDLSAVAFCDSAGLNAMLRTRREAVAAGRGLRLVALSEQVAHLLDLTETRALLAPDLL